MMIYSLPWRCAISFLSVIVGELGHGKEVFPNLAENLVSFFSPHSNTQNTDLSKIFHLRTYCYSVVELSGFRSLSMLLTLHAFPKLH